MAKIQPRQGTFTGGVVSPLLLSNKDLAILRIAAKDASNMIPTVWGPMTRRPGTICVWEVPDQPAARLLPFIFSETDATVLVFSDLNVNFVRDRAVVLDGPSPLAVVTPFADADVAKLQWVWSMAPITRNGCRGFRC